MRHTNFLLKGVLAAATVMYSFCMAASAPEIQLPSTFPSRTIAHVTALDSVPTFWELDPAFFQTTPDSDTWWDSFDDAKLSDLINLGMRNNFTVLAAYHRIQSAAQVQRQTRAGYYPTISANAGWTRDQAAGAINGVYVEPKAMNYFGLGLSMNWEIDVFGRIHAQLKADKADYEASLADYDAVQITMAANIAKSYFQLREAQAQLQVAERNVESAEELMRLARIRYETGLAPALDTVQARITMTQTKASIPALVAEIKTAVNQIGILVGEYPNKLIGLDHRAPLPKTPPAVVSVTPSEIIRRRPDIVEAEKQLAATAAQVGIAKKDFLPVLSLSANVGTRAHKADKLFGDGSLYYNISPTLSWTVFEGMARNARVAEARAQLEVMTDQYNLTVMTAIQEANNAMLSLEAATRQVVYDRSLVKDARRALELQVDRYKQGLNDFSDVMNAQMSLWQYESNAVSAHASQLTALVALYSALGGGWN